MFEKFTDRARKVMQLANQEAQRYQVADFRHRPLEAAQGLYGWMNNEGFGSHVDDSEISVEALGN